MKFPAWGGFVPVFWWMDVDLVSLKGSAMSSSVFWNIYGLGYHDIEWFALETNRDHSVVFEIVSKY